MSTYAVPRPNHLWLGTPISPRFPAVRAAAPPPLFLRVQICVRVQSELFQFFLRQPLYPHSCRPARANPPINFHINTAGSLLCELGDGNVCGDRQMLTSFAPRELVVHFGSPAFPARAGRSRFLGLRTGWAALLHLPPRSYTRLQVTWTT
jgi:hypothetical protein